MGNHISGMRCQGGVTCSALRREGGLRGAGSRSGRTALRCARRGLDIPFVRHCDTADSLVSKNAAVLAVPPSASMMRFARAWASSLSLVSIPVL